jgi:hypothetical protein
MQRDIQNGNEVFKSSMPTMLEAERWDEEKRKKLCRETAQQVRTILNSLLYDYSNYDAVERGIKLRFEITRSILIKNTKEFKREMPLSFPFSGE